MLSRVGVGWWWRGLVSVGVGEGWCWRVLVSVGMGW